MPVTVERTWTWWCASTLTCPYSPRVCQAVSLHPAIEAAEQRYERRKEISLYALRMLMLPLTLPFMLLGKLYALLSPKAKIA